MLEAVVFGVLWNLFVLVMKMKLKFDRTLLMLTRRKYKELTKTEVCEIIANYEEHDCDKWDHIFWDAFDFFSKF
jgi:hypothetical protein